MLAPPPPRSRFVATIEPDRTTVRELVTDARLATTTDLPAGTIVLAERTLEGASVREVLADAGTALADLHVLAARFGVDVGFPDAVMAEVEAVLADPRVDDPALVDLESLPFVTIDSATAKDLDQAVHVEPDGDGWLVRYAIADAGSYVPRESALFAEALRRGASYYLPGLSIPMLPRPLSEGLVSLNPDGPRRALVFAMRVDREGRRTSTELVHARIRSRAKLSFEDVQSLFDAPRTSPLWGSPMEPSLRAMAEVGRARLREASERDVVRYRRREVDVALAGTSGERFVVLEGVRREVELWNEQISLLCNGEGARLIEGAPAMLVQPIYRVHRAPDPSRVESLREAIARLVDAHGLPHEPWLWDEGHTSLAVYVASLPFDGPHARIARAIQRQAILTNVRSRYATVPGPHHGAGFEPYARFSAPMREVVGVYLHGEALQLLTGSPERGGDPLALRAAVADAANRSKDVQRSMTDLVNRRVLDHLFEGELGLGRSERRAWRGTVMGITSGKLHVQLDDPGIDLKIYFYDLAKPWGGVWLEPDELGVLLRERDGGRVRARAGDAITLRVVKRDAERDRWVLEPIAIGEEAAS